MGILDLVEISKKKSRCNVFERYYYQFIEPFERSVFPIFQRNENGESILAGTGFFIAPDGIFLTAAHIFEINVNKNDQFWIVYLDSNGMTHELDILSQNIRPENRDIVVGEVNVAGHEHPIVSIMELLPVINEVVASFAFSHTTIKEPEQYEGKEIQEIRYRNHWEYGIAEEINLKGFRGGFWT